MIQTKHTQMVSDLWKNPADLVKEMTPLKASLDHGAMGVSGEAGELVGAIKNFTKHNKHLDMENVVEELGDLEFYMEAIRQSLGITREETLRANFDKLNKRYHEGQYTDQAAQERADKQEA